MALLLALWLPAGYADFEWLSGDSEFSVEVFPAEGERLILRFHNEWGVRPDHHPINQALADAGVEVWHTDPFSAAMLESRSANVDQIPADDIASLIERALLTGKAVFLLTADRSSTAILRGLHAWQRANPGKAGVAGVIMLSPQLMDRAPRPGDADQVHPAALQVNTPVYLLQPVLSPHRWLMPAMRAALESAGAPVYVQRQRGLRDRYYARRGANDFERAATRELHQHIIGAMKQLARESRPTQAVAAELPERAPLRLRGLQPWHLDGVPGALRLAELGGETVDLNDTAGQVVLVNFWASWCPPCVREMPSMQRLHDYMRGRPFRILAVDVAEPADDIRRFMREHALDFEVLLDLDGAVARDWQVHAYPTSFLIDHRGKVTHSVRGAIEWDEPDTLALIEGLVEQAEGGDHKP